MSRFADSDVNHLKRHEAAYRRRIEEWQAKGDVVYEREGHEFHRVRLGVSCGVLSVLLVAGYALHEAWLAHMPDGLATFVMLFMGVLLFAGLIGIAMAVFSKRTWQPGAAVRLKPAGLDFIVATGCGLRIPVGQCASCVTGWCRPPSQTKRTKGKQMRKRRVQMREISHGFVVITELSAKLQAALEAWVRYQPDDELIWESIDQDQGIEQLLDDASHALSIFRWPGGWLIGFKTNAWHDAASTGFQRAANQEEDAQDAWDAWVESQSGRLAHQRFNYKYSYEPTALVVEHIVPALSAQATS